MCLETMQAKWKGKRTQTGFWVTLSSEVWMKVMLEAMLLDPGGDFKQDSK